MPIEQIHGVSGTSRYITTAIPYVNAVLTSALRFGGGAGGHARSPLSTAGIHCSSSGGD